MDKDITLSDPIVELGESLKLTKNSKGYTWEIRLRCKGEEVIDDAFISRMSKLNDKMIMQFENQTGYHDPEPVSRTNIKGSPYGFSEDHA